MGRVRRSQRHDRRRPGPRSSGSSTRQCREVDGIGFCVTPFARSAALSDALGFSRRRRRVGQGRDRQGRRQPQGAPPVHRCCCISGPPSCWGSRPGRRRRPAARLAIASCGNAALAAATLARAAAWPIEVFVPDMGRSRRRRPPRPNWAPRSPRASVAADDPPGDPTIHRFREAVDAGAVPFRVQGPENALCLDGGRTIGWEMMSPDSTGPARRSTASSSRSEAERSPRASARPLGPPASIRRSTPCRPRCAPWRGRGAGQAPTITGARWAELMTPWPGPHSTADGILDDETYDWLGVFEAMRALRWARRSSRPRL